MSISELYPKRLWTHFAALNAVPRASKKEERVIDFMLQFGKSLGLETEKDHIGNVLIRKPATQNMTNKPIVIMQSHLDMVHQKNSDTLFDFDNQGIDMFIDGDWVKARGTTLGADNGIGVATIMAILESNDIEHPAIEALFTIDEETGMTGALELKPNWLKGSILLNLDTEEDDEIGIGCAGGMDVTADGDYKVESIDVENYTGIKINVRGLQGGHSGMDIHKGYGNANKIMNRIVYTVNDSLRIHSFSGGSLRNAIPRESTLVGLCRNEEMSSTLEKLNDCIAAAIKDEFKSLEPNLTIDIIVCDTPTTAMSAKDQARVVNTLYAAHNGVFRMSPDIKDLVEASNNVARVEIADGNVKILCLTRSSVESSKYDVAYCLKSTFELAGLAVTFSGEYPGWSPNVNSPILKTMKELYKQINGSDAHVAACHAGLECGIIGKHYPGLDMISFGPTIRGAHSPDERASISSTAKFWDFTISILKAI
jgi:dipeptidase D